MAWSVYRNPNGFHATNLGTFLLDKRPSTDKNRSSPQIQPANDKLLSTVDVDKVH